MRKSAFVFVSQPTKLSERQAAARDWVLDEMAEVGLEPRTVGVSDYASKSPLLEVCVLARHCSGALVLGFEQTRIETGRARPNTKHERVIADEPQASPWNQLEAGILIALRLPLLVVREPGITGGVFDPGSGDHFVNDIDPAVFARGEPDEALRQALRSWAHDVWAHYRGVW